MKRAGGQNLKSRGNRRYSRTPVTTYYRSDKTGRSPFQPRPPKKNRRRYWFGAADILLIIVLLAALAYSLVLRSRPIVIASNSSFHTADQYSRLIQADFSGLTNKNKITFNESLVIKRIEKQFPEVSAVSVELPFFSEQPRVRLLVSPPAFKLENSSHIYIINKQGIAVTDLYQRKQFASLSLVDDQSGFKAAVGRPALSSNDAAFISNVLMQCQRAKVPLSVLTLPPTPQEFDLRTRDQPYYVKFYLAGDPVLQAGQFLAARQKFAQTHITPSQYLDVRVAGKVFYK